MWDVIVGFTIDNTQHMLHDILYSYSTAYNDTK